MILAIVLALGVGVFVAMVLAGVAGGRPSDPLDLGAQERWLVRHAPAPVRGVLRAVDRRVAGGALVAVPLAVVVLGAAVVGWVLDTVDRGDGFARWDEAAAEWGARRASSTSTQALDLLTELGGTGWLLVIMTVVGTGALIRHRQWSPLLYLAMVGIGVSIVNNGLKWLVDRDRPEIAQLTGHSGSSFPSGHSAAAAACWAALALVLTRFSTAPARLVAAATAVAIAITVAATRVLLGVHWLTDVIAGVVVGWTWFVVCTVTFGGRLLVFGEPAARLRHVAHDGRQDEVTA